MRNCLAIGVVLLVVAMCGGASYYVDPGGGSDVTGDGTSDATAWQTIQHALDNITQGATGDTIHIKAGTADTLSATLDLSTYGTPAYNKPLTFRGYASAANDGSWTAQTGICEINGGDGDFTLINSAGVHFVHCHLTNTGTAYVVTIGQYGSAIQCKVDVASGGGISLGDYGSVVDCHIEETGGYGVLVGAATGNAKIIACYLKSNTTDFTSAIRLVSNSCNAINNIISVDGASDGIELRGYSQIVVGNSILSAGGTGQGVTVTSSNALAAVIANNLVDGFSGAGGIGIDIPGTWSTPVIAYNAVYNCTTKYTTITNGIYTGDNEELSSASPFAKSGSDTWANRAVYFAPAASVQGGALPDGLRRDKGAVQHADPAASGGETSHVWVR